MLAGEPGGGVDTDAMVGSFVKRVGGELRTRGVCLRKCGDAAGR